MELTIQVPHADATGAPNPTADRAPDDAEREAARLAIEGTPLERLRAALFALRALMRHPNDTKQAFYLGLLVNRSRYANFIARLTLDDEGARLLREQPAIDSRHIDFDALRALPPDTLGGAYVRFLDERRLDPDLFRAPPGLPELPAYVSQRMRQVHDLWHVLTGYDSDLAGEVALQAFTFAQTGMPSAALIAGGAILRFGLRRPRIVFLAVQGYLRGRRARFLPPLRLEDRFERPLDEVRRELRLDTV
jgi:ubiquinone biosynthesis protein COQ4